MPIMKVSTRCILLDEMPKEMRNTAISFTIEALKRYNMEKDAAGYIKQQMVSCY